jgi:hypothetical protein
VWLNELHGARWWIRWRIACNPLSADKEMELTGRSIKIFLIDGTASHGGARTFDNKAVVVLRASLAAVSKRHELQKTGVYVLVGGDSDKPGFKKIYLGEGDTILPRLI